MGRPAELTDRPQFLKAKSRVDQRLGIPRPAGGITADVNHPLRLAVRDGRDLLAGTGAGRIENHRVDLPRPVAQNLLHLSRDELYVPHPVLPGIEPPKDELILHFEWLGEMCAHLHLHAKGFIPPVNFVRPSWTPEVILDDQAGFGPWQNGVDVKGDTLALLSRLENVVRKRLGEAPTDRDNFGLIHSDLRLASLLGDGDSTAVIDFDDCGYGWYLFDLAGALTLLEERPDVPQLIASWLAGYRKISQTPADSEEIIPTLIMLRRFQLIGWLGDQQQHLEFTSNIGLTVN